MKITVHLHLVGRPFDGILSVKGRDGETEFHDKVPQFNLGDEVSVCSSDSSGSSVTITGIVESISFGSGITLKGAKIVCPPGTIHAEKEEHQLKHFKYKVCS